jgi:hypothetical protein
MIRKATSHYKQNVVGRVINQLIINIYKELCSKYPFELLLQIHDSVLVQRPIEMREFAHQEYQRLSKIEIDIGTRKFFIPIEIKTGKNFAFPKEKKHAERVEELA